RFQLTTNRLFERSRAVTVNQETKMTIVIDRSIEKRDRHGERIVRTKSSQIAGVVARLNGDFEAWWILWLSSGTCARAAADGTATLFFLFLLWLLGWCGLSYFRRIDDELQHACLNANRSVGEHLEHICLCTKTRDIHTCAL